MPLQNAFMLLLLGTIWGASYLFIKVTVADIPPFTFVVLRTGIAGLILVATLLMRGRRLPRGRRWLSLSVMGLFNALIPYALIMWGEIHISSSLAAVLNASMPLFTVVIAHFWAVNERIDRFKAIGVLVGFGGVVLLLLPDLGEGMTYDLLGGLAVVGAGLSYAIAAVYARRNFHDEDPIMLSSGQLLTGFAMTLPLAFLLERPFSITPSPIAWGSLLALSVFGTAIAYVIYYWLLEHGGSVQASLVTYIIPVGAMFWGWLLLRESIHWTFIVGLAAILLGIMIANRFQIVRSLSR
jgi:drug/metabolite transporter (DMT)-like permease